MRRYLLSVTIAILAGLGISHEVFAAMAVPPPPANGYYVLDQTATLTEDQIASLNDQIGSYRKRTSVQLAVLMVPTIKDDYLENFSINVARTWGVGEKDKNNGVLLLIAKDDRKLRIEVGTGLEGDLTDARSSRIIRDRITPEFRKGDYYSGIKSGLEGISLAISSSNDPLLSTSSPSSSDVWSRVGDVLTFGFVIVWILLSWLGSILGRTKSWWLGGIVGAVLGGGGTYLFSNLNLVLAVTAATIFAILGLAFDYVVSKNYKAAKAGGHSPSWWAGGSSFGGGGSSGGGGFSGGSFGGGGASGSW